MTARLVQAPINVVDCDGCGTTYTPTAAFNQRTHGRARVEAAAAGWKVRPPRGPGAKTAPDLCPACQTKQGAAS
jgi:hypothetical protein